MKFLFHSSFAHLALDPTETRVSGGAELQVALLARELVKRGHECVLVSGDHGQPDNRMLQGVRSRLGGKFQTGGLVDTLQALPVSFRVIEEERPDFTFIYGWTTWLFFLLWSRARKHTRIGFTCMLDTEVNGEFRRENPVRGALFERGIRAADVRYAITDYEVECFKRMGLDSTLYRPLVMPRTVPLSGVKDIDFLWIARCQPIKRPHLFLDLAEALLSRFEDQETGGFFFTSHDHEPLIQRPKSAFDNATPAGNGIAALSLQRLGHLTGEVRYLQAAEKTLRAFATVMGRNPAACPSMVMALDEYLVPPAVVILRGPQAGVQSWKEKLDKLWLPSTLVMALPEAIRDLPVVLERPMQNNVNAWVCRGVECLPAIADWDALLETLRPLGNKGETRL